MHPASARTADLPPKWRLSWLNGISCGDAGQTYSVAFLESTPGWAIFARAIRRRSEAGAQHACDEAFQPNGALYCPSNSLPGGDRVVRLLGHKPLCGQMLHRAFLLTISRMALPHTGSENTNRSVRLQTRLRTGEAHVYRSLLSLRECPSLPRVHPALSPSGGFRWRCVSLLRDAG